MPDLPPDQYGKLVELFVENPIVSFKLLREHKLYNKAALEALYYMDTVSVNEARAVIRSNAELWLYYKRRKGSVWINNLRHSPSPSITPVQYYEILCMRDTFDDIKDVAVRLMTLTNVTMTTIYRIAKKLNINLHEKNFILKEDTQKLNAYEFTTHRGPKYKIIDGNDNCYQIGKL